MRFLKKTQRQNTKNMVYGNSLYCDALKDICEKNISSEHVEFLIGDKIIKDDPSYLQRAWKYIVEQLSALFEKGIGFISKISWKVVVDLGKIPDFLENLVVWLEEVLIATGTKLLALGKKISKALTLFWEYVSELFELPEFLKRIRDETLGLDWSASSVVTVFSKVARTISRYIVQIVQAVFSVVKGAVTMMCSVTYSVFDMALKIPNNTRIKTVVAKAGFFLINVVSDIDSIKSLTRDAAKTRLYRLSKQFVTNTKEVVTLLSDSNVDFSKDLESSYWFEAIYKETFSALNQIMSWIFSGLEWLFSMLTQIPVVALDWIYSIASAVLFLGNAFGEWFQTLKASFEEDEKTRTTNTIPELFETAQKLQKAPEVPKQNRRALRKAMEFGQNMMGPDIDYKMQNASAKQYKKEKDAMREINAASTLLALLYTESDDQIEIQNLVETIAREKYGNSTWGLANNIEAVRQFLDFEIVRATDAMLEKIENEQKELLSGIGGKYTPEELMKMSKEDLENLENEQKNEFEKAKITNAILEKQRALDRIKREEQVKIETEKKLIELEESERKWMKELETPLEIRKQNMIDAEEELNDAIQNLTAFERDLNENFEFNDRNGYLTIMADNESLFNRFLEQKKLDKKHFIKRSEVLEEDNIKSLVRVYSRTNNDTDPKNVVRLSLQTRVFLAFFNYNKSELLLNKRQTDARLNVCCFGPKFKASIQTWKTAALVFAGVAPIIEFLLYGLPIFQRDVPLQSTRFYPASDGGLWDNFLKTAGLSMVNIFNSREWTDVFNGIRGGSTLYAIPFYIGRALMMILQAAALVTSGAHFFALLTFLHCCIFFMIIDWIFGERSCGGSLLYYTERAASKTIKVLLSVAYTLVTAFVFEPMDAAAKKLDWVNSGVSLIISGISFANPAGIVSSLTQSYKNMIVSSKKLMAPPAYGDVIRKLPNWSDVLPAHEYMFQKQPDIKGFKPQKLITIVKERQKQISFQQLENAKNEILNYAEKMRIEQEAEQRARIEYLENSLKLEQSRTKELEDQSKSENEGAVVPYTPKVTLVFSSDDEDSSNEDNTL